VGVVLLLLGVLIGCGAPQSGTTRMIDTTTVPYELTAPRQTASPTTTSTPERLGPHVWLVRDDALVAIGTQVDSDDPQTAAGQVLDRLRASPSDADRDEGLTSALPPQTRLKVVGFEAGQLTIEIRSSKDPPADQLALATGQVVLSATSVIGVDSVTFTSLNEPQEATLPGGVRVNRPVTAADYDSLVER
jgi:hypothetical protein